MDQKHIKKLFKEFRFFKKKTLPNGFGCGDGWFNIIYGMSQNLINFENLSDTFVITSVIEKYGDLEVWSKGGNNTTRSIIDNAKEEANLICDACGNNKDDGLCAKCATAPVDPNYNPLDLLDKVDKNTSAAPPPMPTPPPIAVPNPTGIPITIGDCKQALIQWCQTNIRYIFNHEFGLNNPSRNPQGTTELQLLAMCMDSTKWEPYPAEEPTQPIQWEIGDPHQDSWTWVPGTPDEPETFYTSSASATAIRRCFNQTDFDDSFRGYVVIDNNQIIKAWAQGE